MYTIHGRPIYEAELQEILEKHYNPSAAAASSASAPPPGLPPLKTVCVADSGFGCVALVVAGAKLGICFICSVKLGHRRFPKDILTKTLKDAPGGKWALCETNIDGVGIVCAGYKYNAKKTLFFAWPKGAARCVPGEPYIATFVDGTGNRVAREVMRLSVLSRYFAYANVVDVHDQYRQDCLDLEYTWVTKDCWFRLFTTILGVVITDSYLAVTRGLNPRDPDKEMTMMKFADRLALELIENDDEDQYAPMPTRSGPRRAIEVAPDEHEIEATLLPDNVHRLVAFGKHASGYVIQRRCAVCGTRSTAYCAAVQCGADFPVCREGSAKHHRKCFEEHKAKCYAQGGTAGPPAKRKK